jgi:hypothetical protein
MRRWWLGTLTVVLALLPTAAAPAAVTAHHAARHFRGVASVGALFLPGLYPSLHTCSASVIRSSAGDVIMTAAHCVSGSGVGYRFAPGYHDGKTPYGVWNVTAAYGDPAWISGQDPHRDWAFLTVADRRIHGRLRSLQSVTGGSRLGHTARRGRRVTVIGYGIGRNDRPIRCKATVYRHRGYPAFNCGGYVGGTSGSPWLRRTAAGRVVVGDIGGLHQGGCTPSTSYSPPLGKPAHRALSRAGHGKHADVFPAAGSDGCS